MSVTKFDIDNSRFEITKEQILEIVEGLDCLSSMKEQLKKYYSKDFNVTREKTQYYDRTLARVRPLMDYYNCNVYMRGDIVIEGEDTDQFLQEIEKMADKFPITEDIDKQIKTYAKLIEGGYMEVRIEKTPHQAIELIGFRKTTDKLMSEVLATI